MSIVIAALPLRGLLIKDKNEKNEIKKLDT
jgi:hypothetical protein